MRFSTNDMPPDNEGIQASFVVFGGGVVDSRLNSDGFPQANSVRNMQAGWTNED